ncbi:MAG: DUF465 domain-containing protein [Pseudomonadota bacterium]
MSHVPHELAEEFPNSVDRIHELKLNDPHFARLAEEYHEINRTLHRMETRVEPTDDFSETELRKQRIALKDQIYALLTQ